MTSTTVLHHAEAEFQFYCMRVVTIANCYYGGGVLPSIPVPLLP